MNNATIALLSKTSYVATIYTKMVKAKEEGKDVADELFVVLPYGEKNGAIDNLLKMNSNFGKELYPEAEYPEDASEQDNLITNIHYLIQESVE